MIPRAIFLVIAFALFPTLGAADEAPKFTDMSVIALHSGTNKISGFAPDGPDGIVTKAWRDNGNAHGFNVFTVMMRNRKAPKDEEWEFVSFFDGNTETLTLTDAPHTTEDFVRSIRFVRGAVDGHRETLAIVANRNIMGGDGIPDQTTVSLTVFKLITRADNAPVGRPTHYFERFKSWRNSRQYCNSDTALAVELGLPAPDYWPASNLPGGCP